MIAPTIPIGRRSVKASLPSPACEASIGTISPASLRASTAAIVYVDIARCASTRAAFIGLPASSEIRRAASSWRRPRQPATRTRISARLCAGSGSRIAALGGVDRAPRLGRAGLRDPADDVAGERRADLEPVARSRSTRRRRAAAVLWRLPPWCEDTPVNVPDVSYARSGDVAIAYQAVGAGPPDLVLLPFLSNLYTLWHAPGFAAIARRLATGRRLILVNPRGIGLSDRPRGLTIESRMDDLRAVVDDLEIERPALLGLAEGAASCAVFAATLPERVERLVLYTPWTRGRPTPPSGMRRSSSCAGRGRNGDGATCSGRAAPAWSMPLPGDGLPPGVPRARHVRPELPAVPPWMGRVQQGAIVRRRSDWSRPRSCAAWRCASSERSPRDRVDALRGRRQPRCRRRTRRTRCWPALVLGATPDARWRTRARDAGAHDASSRSAAAASSTWRTCCSRRIWRARLA